MALLPDVVSKAWEQRSGPAVLATVDEAGCPNVVYVGSVSKYSEDTLLVADNYFDKTRRNILAGSRGALVFLGQDRQSFQIKGRLSHHRSGPLYDDMKRWNPDRHPGYAAVALTVDEVYRGAQRLV